MHVSLFFQQAVAGGGVFFETLITIYLTLLFVISFDSAATSDDNDDDDDATVSSVSVPILVLRLSVKVLETVDTNGNSIVIELKNLSTIPI